MAVNRIVSVLLILLVFGAGVGAEIPHHHHDHEDEAHAEMCDQLCHCVHFQILGLTASHTNLLPAPEADTIHSLYQLSLPLPPLFRIERPPKSHLS